jgi:hypothetical protein|tara:strand:+ start:934 stop:1554 length:621 start_codon:yes stop_codon:yes gene_type:complete
MTTDAIWPTWIYSTVVKNHSEIYNKFLPYLNDETNFDKPWSQGSCSSTIRNSNNDSMPWKVWFDSVTPCIEEHLGSLEPTMPFIMRSDEFWVNLYNKGDFQEAHEHAFPGRSISAIYVMESDEDIQGGDLVFECPNFNVVKFSGLNRLFNKWQYQHVMPKLTPGTLILFPSWVTHYVLPLQSDKRRITIAANFSIEEATSDDTANW